MKIATVLLLISLQVACAIPVVLIGQDGRVFRGANNSVDGTFYVSGHNVVCQGSYNQLIDSKTISMPVSCSDGRTGIVRATRDTAFSGSGTVRFSDGYTGDFLYGEAAKRL